MPVDLLQYIAYKNRRAKAREELLKVQADLASLEDQIDDSQVGVHDVDFEGVKYKVHVRAVDKSKAVSKDEKVSDLEDRLSQPEPPTAEEILQIMTKKEPLGSFVKVSVTRVKPRKPRAPRKQAEEADDEADA